MSEGHRVILIIGGRGEFGQFLQQDILPHLCTDSILISERETPPEEYQALIESARHILLSTPLAGYAEMASRLVEQCRDRRETVTLWFIPSVQAGVWRAARATLERMGNPYLSAVSVHPMYGPHGFQSTESLARTFQNVLTALYEGLANPLAGDLTRICHAFRQTFNIETTRAFNPEEHDRITAYSQGLSYCIARLMFEQPEFEELLRKHLPDLHQSFRANQDLIFDFIRLNTYMPQVTVAFTDAWRQTAQSDYADLLRAFARADTKLNPGGEPRILTKWYERLRAASNQS